MNRYVFIIVLIMCVIPGVIMTITDEAGFTLDTMVACAFKEKNIKPFNPTLNSELTVKNISESFKKHEDTSKITSFSKQSVTLKEGSSPDKWSEYMKRQKIKCKAPGVAGLLGNMIEQPAFGCSPQISQTIDTQMTEIKEDLIDDYEEITGHIVSDISMNVRGGQKNDDKLTPEQKEANKFLEDKTDEIEKDVKDLLQKIRDKLSDNEQNKVIEFTTPFSCDCERKGPLYNQETKLQMASQELYDQVRKRIIDKSLEAGMKIDLEGETQEEPVGKQLLCFFQILACTASVLALFWVVYSIATNKDAIEEDKQNSAARSVRKMAKQTFKLEQKKADADLVRQARSEGRFQEKGKMEQLNPFAKSNMKRVAEGFENKGK